MVSGRRAWCSVLNRTKHPSFNKVCLALVLVIPPVRVPLHPLPDFEPTSLGLGVVYYCLELVSRMNGEALGNR